MLTAHPHHPRGAALPAQVELPAHRQHRVDRRAGRHRRNSPYNAAKAGVIGLTRGLAVELGREGITVNCICPGPIRTGMTEWIPEEQKKSTRGAAPRSAATAIPRRWRR